MRFKRTTPHHTTLQLHLRLHLHHQQQQEEEQQPLLQQLQLQLQLLQLLPVVPHKAVAEVSKIGNL